MEALIEFAIPPGMIVSTDVLALDAEVVVGVGGSVSPIHGNRAEILFQPGSALPVVTADSGVIGYRFETAESDRVVQFRLDGMTYSIIGAYTTWEDLEEHALEALRLYQGAFEARVPVCPAARFINRIELPFNVPLDRFLRATPPVPAGIDAGITAFESQTQFLDPSTHLAAVFTLASGPQGGDATTGSVLLDISVRSAETFAVNSGLADTMSALRAELRRIRDMKNAVFFGALASPAVSLYQEPT